MKLNFNEYFEELNSTSIEACEFIECSDHMTEMEEFDIFGYKHELNPLKSDKIKLKKEGGGSLQQKSPEKTESFTYICKRASYSQRILRFFYESAQKVYVDTQ
ncbi:hypothetical protein AYI69_g10478 [Smittium culicis]|uniref:Uncharacterized protein n=1 Tax=Smittium culicis TaxID=133412 RepID=A0A1R1X5F5_9FUNG|nr:hypothetical protein AYI69_g10478 [Smittium culicis]